MSDGCKIDSQGFENVINNLKKITPKLKAALALDAQNVASNMEKWSKDNVPWTDRTAHARLFLKTTVKWIHTDELMIALSHGVEYGIYLELANEGKYAILEKAIKEFTPEFMDGWKTIVQSAGVI